MKTLARLAVVALSLLPALAGAAEEDGIRFFEQKIRPVLVEQCYSCHSVPARDAKKLQGALYLDSAAGVAAGGETVRCATACVGAAVSKATIESPRRSARTRAVAIPGMTESG